MTNTAACGSLMGTRCVRAGGLVIEYVRTCEVQLRGGRERSFFALSSIFNIEDDNMGGKFVNEVEPIT